MANTGASTMEAGYPGGVTFSRLFAPTTLPLVLSWLVLGSVVLLGSIVFYMTFVPRLPTDPGLTLKHWTDIARPFIVEEVLPNTFLVGVGTVLVTLFFAAPLAWLLNRTSLPYRNVFMALMAVVVIVPGFVKAMGWIILVNERIGLLNKTIASQFGLDSVPISLENPFGMAWVMGLSLTPTMFFLISGPIRSLDPTLEEAAGVAGANRWWTFLRISMPLVWPAILGGAIYNFMTAISIFEVPAMLGAAGGQVPVLSTELFYAVHPSESGGASEISYGAAGVYGVLISIPSLVALYCYHQVMNKAHRYGVITGKGYRPREVDLGRFKYAALAFIMFYLLLAVFLPMLVLIWMSLLPYLQMPSIAALSKISLDNYQPDFFFAVIGGPRVIWNTVVLLVSTPILVLFFSVMTSWVVVRTKVRLRKTMDTIAMLPHAIPGLAFAFALFIVALFIDRWFPHFPLMGTVGIIMLANLLNRLAYGTRITNAALLQVQAELEESAQICGARTFTTIIRVLVPLIKPSMIFAGLWTAMLTFREVSMALFLTGPRNRVLSVAVWRIWESGDQGPAAAAAVVMVGITGLLLLIALSVSRGRFTLQRPTGSVTPGS